MFGFRLAQVVGISGAAWLAGNVASLSTIVTPVLLQSHKEDNISSRLLAKQWRGLFEKGRSTNPPIAAGTASSLIYLAWAVRRGSPLYKSAAYSRSGLYIAAAILTVGIVPFTFVFMDPTNDVLIEKARSTSDSDPEVSELIKRWTRLNFGRSLLPLAAAVCGVVATII
ncbi:DUF1772-domain-containing protein [Penicillium angulare]|uniref:DUF1772-domain-containing protein n=1 Tax=Penicillium angulare TaxID=116970 RepID=A0A9W9G7N4_9EURO|nr:DUF1772-domain-containing protein [Penicillium angulare]